MPGRAHLIRTSPGARRHTSRAWTGAVAWTALLLSATGCAGPLELDAPRVSGADARACKALVEALPASVADQEQRSVDAGPGYAAAWGDPAIELRCGVARPAGLDRFAACQVVNGVGWWIPEAQQTGRPEPITMTTVGRALDVEVRLPESYWPPATAMVDLAPALTRTIRTVRPCV
ncbi:MAG TPA: DUF3515 domain-containing protein [Nocardioidaceae bacterium]|nr:DUF3515 domain-containing protein [Nocardioidaceae bacterium]